METFKLSNDKYFVKKLRDVVGLYLNPPEHALIFFCIVDNYSTHKHQKVKFWLEKHPRFHFHFIPTSSSWLNLVERWFGEITRKRIRRGTFQSVAGLVKAIEEYIQINNQNPKPFIWTKTAEEIITKVNSVKLI